jgi:hypothetical protein
LLAGCGAAQQPARVPLEVTPHSLYPLAAGNAWSYDVDTGRERVLAVSRVERLEGGVASVRSGEQTLQYELRPDGVYRPARQGYLLRAPIAPAAEWDAGAGTIARIVAVDLVLQTPAGRFEQCVRVSEDGASGAHIETTYCPGVGPVIVMSELALSRETARVTARLRGYVVVGKQ